MKRSLQRAGVSNRPTTTPSGGGNANVDVKESGGLAPGWLVRWAIGAVLATGFGILLRVVLARRRAGAASPAGGYPMRPPGPGFGQPGGQGHGQHPPPGYGPPQGPGYGQPSAPGYGRPPGQAPAQPPGQGPGPAPGRPPGQPYHRPPGQPPAPGYGGPPSGDDPQSGDSPYPNW